KQLEQVKPPIWNPPEVLRWNMNKLYLKELRETGVPVIPSVFIPQGARVPLDSVMEEKNWERVVVKPLIGAGGYKMSQIDRSEADSHQEDVQRLADERGVLIQPYLTSIEENGEFSFVFFGGAYSYAVHKLPAKNEYLVHKDRGGHYEKTEPSDDLIRQAGECLSNLTKQWLYLRLDAVQVEGRLKVVELEALEPSFYFDTVPEGAEYFAEAIEQFIVEEEIPEPAIFSVE
ncbi:MAG: RimK family alpha-L-glutamate ligase, partial [bacterium]